MRFILALATIPVVTFGATLSLRSTPQPLPVKSVTTLPIRPDAVEVSSFRLRWAPVADLPPTVVERVVEVAPADAVVATVAEPVRAKARPVLRLTVCARHGMRKVTYYRRGYEHWRCRR